MKTVCLKLEKNVLKEIDSGLKKHRYSTRTEFIRDAIRDKLSAMEKEAILKHIKHLQGWSKRRTTDEQLHAVREKVFEELERKFKLR